MPLNGRGTVPVEVRGDAVAKSANVASWRKNTPEEMVAYYESMKEKNGKKSKKRSAFLVVRSRLRPFDVYSYLRARFGIPNGFQNMLRKDDSDNWIHWDFNLKADDVDGYIVGTSRRYTLHDLGRANR